eukprot:CAMPEP_0206139964 /NCGR_PEP_ID=MMETSP1473-20131121/7834_1 /ASSEMBLY_ACC=CAM_ASM_001109 /TAXON_ID=1461547 /ORGANISM="Stichococcus sp, Strain RCC1054" /LENGTH=70 /DNA_ID=CAMNT_0053533921 /DNA_START=869 /DNA_END=1081 /DNA_ORIENTATION=+
MQNQAPGLYNRITIDNAPPPPPPGAAPPAEAAAPSPPACATVVAEPRPQGRFKLQSRCCLAETADAPLRM